MRARGLEFYDGSDWVEISIDEVVQSTKTKDKESGKKSKESGKKSKESDTKVKGIEDEGAEETLEEVCAESCEDVCETEEVCEDVETCEEVCTDDCGVPEQLFDIRMELEGRVVENASDLMAVVTYESFGSVPTPVDLMFEIFDGEGNLVYSEIGYIVVTVEEVRRYEFPDLNLPEGEYEFVFTTLYNVDVEDEFRQNFSIERKGFFERIWGWVWG